MTLPSPPPADVLDRERAAWRSSDTLAVQADARLALVSGELAYAMPSPDGGAEDAGYTVENGVAVVSISGALMSRGGWYWDGYEFIAKRVDHAHANASVRAVMLDVNSPGGMVAGMLDGMRALRAAKTRSGKRMVAWVGAGAYSAAYGLASTCDEIVIDELAGVGSIGVLDTMCSRIEEARKAGVDVRVIASGAEKTDGHPFVAITDEAEARKVDRVMMMASAFAREIAVGRPSLPADAALALNGGLRFGRAAVADALADRLSTRAALVAELSATKPTLSPGGPRGSASTDPPTRNTATMNEKQLAALTALLATKTGETDPDRQLGALSATFEQASTDRGAAVELAALKKKIADDAAAAAAAAEAKARTDAFHAAVKVGEDDGKLTPSEAEQWRADFAKGECTIGVLEGNLARRSPIPALSPEHKDLRAPASPPTGAGLKPRLAALAARPYASLDWNERNELATAAPDTHDRLYRQWVDEGRPRAPQPAAG